MSAGFWSCFVPINPFYFPGTPIWTGCVFPVPVQLLCPGVCNWEFYKIAAQKLPWVLERALVVWNDVGLSLDFGTIGVGMLECYM